MCSFCDLPREAEETEEAEGPAPQNHGGIVVYFKSIYRVKVTALPVRVATYEALCLSFATARGPLTLLAIYRPGSSPPSSAFLRSLPPCWKHLLPITANWL